MQNVLKSNEWRRSWVLQFSKIEIEKWDQITQPFCRIGCTQEIRSLLYNLTKFGKTEEITAESCRTHWNLMNYEEIGSFKFLKFKYRRGDQIIQPFCRIGSAQELRSPLFNLRKFQKTDKTNAESFRTHWNPMNDEEFAWFKFLKLKYRRENQIIQLFCRTGFPQEIRSPLFNLRKFQKTEKSTAESCRMHWNLMNDEEFGSFKFLKLKYKSGDQII